MAIKELLNLPGWQVLKKTTGHNRLSYRTVRITADIVTWLKMLVSFPFLLPEFLQQRRERLNRS